MAYRDRESGIVVKGFSEIQKALREVDRGTERELKKRLRTVGQDVAVVARGNVSHRTGRHDGPRIEDNIRVSVTRSRAEVFSTAPQAGAQNVGGRVGRGGRTTLKRSDVSGYMQKAVQSEREHVSQELEGLLDWLDETFGK